MSPLTEEEIQVRGAQWTRPYSQTESVWNQFAFIAAPAVANPRRGRGEGGVVFKSPRSMLRASRSSRESGTQEGGVWRSCGEE